jgi:hypothetical protein
VKSPAISMKKNKAIVSASIAAPRCFLKCLVLKPVTVPLCPRQRSNEEYRRLFFAISVEVN